MRKRLFSFQHVLVALAMLFSFYSYSQTWELVSWTASESNNTFNGGNFDNALISSVQNVTRGGNDCWEMDCCAPGYGPSGILATANAGSNCPNDYLTNSYPDTVDPATMPYMEFAFNVNGTQTMNWDKLVLDGVRCSQTVRLDVRSSLDNYASSLGYIQLQSASGSHTYWGATDISELNNSYPTANGLVSFRLYLYNNRTGNGVVQFNDNATVSTQLGNEEGQDYLFTMYRGGSDHAVSLWSSIPVPQPTITSFSPTSAQIGDTVTITGTDFTGITEVSFGGTATTNYTVDSSTQITATVPVGATTGVISVTNAGGTASAQTSSVLSEETAGTIGGAIWRAYQNFSTGNDSVSLSSVELVLASDAVAQHTVSIYEGSFSGPNNLLNLSDFTLVSTSSPVTIGSNGYIYEDYTFDFTNAQLDANTDYFLYIDYDPNTATGNRLVQFLDGASGGAVGNVVNRRLNHKINVLSGVVFTVTVPPGTLIADYNLTSTGRQDATGNHPGNMNGRSTMFSANGACSINQRPQGLDRLETVDLTLLNRSDFQIDVNVDLIDAGVYSSSDDSKAVLVLDGSMRTLGIGYDKTNSRFSLFHENNTEAFSTNTFALGNVYDLSLQYIDGTAKLMVNGVVEITTCIPPLRLSPIGNSNNKIYLGGNPGNIQWVQACYKDLKVYNDVTPLPGPSFNVPTITSISDVSACEGADLNVTATVADVEDADGSLTVEVTSSDQAVFADSDITATNSNGTVTITGTPLSSGSATLTVMVTDSCGSMATEIFDVDYTTCNLTVRTAGAQAEGTTWEYANGVISALGTAIVSPVDIISYQTNANLEIKATNITIQDGINSTGTNSLSFTAGNLITVGGNIITDAATGNGISFAAKAISQATGADVITEGADISYTATGFQATAGNDLVTLFAGANASNTAYLDANGGDITINSSFATGGVIGGSDRALQMTNTDIITSGSGSVTINVDATENPNTTTSAWGMQLYSTVKVITESGPITLAGMGGHETGNSRGIAADNGNFSLLSQSGTITLRDTKSPNFGNGNYTGLYLQPQITNGIVIGANGSDVATSTSNILIEADRLYLDSRPTQFNTSGTFTVQSVANDFAANVSLQSIQLANTVNSVVIGKTGNTAGVKFINTLTSPGPIAVFGGDIDINGNLTATNQSVTLSAINDIQQSNPIVASTLNVIKADNLVLRNSNNNIETLIVGSSSERVGDVTYRDANELAIDQVGSDAGVYATGEILIETVNGDLTIAQDINTTSSSTDAIIINAGQQDNVDELTSGDIIISGTPSVTASGTGAIVKLFSGDPDTSAGLITLVGGDANARGSVDETTSVFTPALEADNSYALFRASISPYTLNTSSITDFDTCFGSNSAEQSFSVSAEPLTSDMVVTAPSNWEVSTTSGSGFANSITLTPTNGNVAETTIYIRTIDTAPSGSINGTVVISSSGVDSQEFDVTGTVGVVPQPLVVSNSLCEANSLEWVVFNSITSTTGTGTLFGNVTATVTHSNGGMRNSTMFSHPTFPTEYTVPANNVVRNDRAGTFTISFSEPIANPQVAISSIGNPSTPVGIITSVPYQVIWNGTGMTYTDSSNMTGREGFTIVSFPGTHSSLTFDYLNDESYATMAFGAQNPACNNITLCEGDSITLTASGGSSYEWSPAVGLNTTTGAQVIATPTQTTTYSVIDTDDACAEAKEVTITVNLAPQAPTLSGNANQLVCEGDTVADLQATVPNDETLRWFSAVTGGTALASTEVLVGGRTYYAEAVSANGCSSSSRTPVFIATNNSLYFDGIDDYVSLARPTIQDGATAFTIELWIQPDATNFDDNEYHAIFGNQPGSLASSRNPSFYLKSGQIHVDSYEDVTLTRYDLLTNSPTPYILQDVWSHVALVKDGLNFYVYINGELAVTTPAPNAVNISGPYQFGFIDNYFAGLMDEVRFWDVARSQTEIQNNMDISLTGQETGLLGYYTFNQGAANGNNTSITQLNDTTSNANAGTFNNMSLTGSISNFVKGYFPQIIGGDELTVGDTLTLSHAYQDGVWSISNSNIATISTSGVVTGVNSGTVTVTFTSCGNSSFKEITVTNTPPNAVCVDYTVQLDASGVATILPSDVDGGSNDAESAITLSLSQTNFTCANLGDNTVTLTVTDAGGLIDTCTATVTVVDSIAPTAVAQDITVQLDAMGTASITPADIDNGSSDNCSFTMALDTTSFGCDDLGANTVTLTVTDASGNIDTATATVTVEDTIAPTVVTQDITVQLGANGVATITGADVDGGSTDNCSVELSVTPAAFNCANLGVNTVVVIGTDPAGNQVFTTATVTVEDVTAPVAVTQDITVELDATGSASITTVDIDNGSSDNCGIQTMALDTTMFDCSNLGANTVTLTVTDANGLTNTATAVVTVVDVIAPTAVAQDVTVQLDANGQAVITATDIDNGSTDTCGIDSMSLSKTMFDCDDLGNNFVVLTVTDAAGNSSNAFATVVVEDTTAPIVVAQNITVQLNQAGIAPITAAMVDGGSSDNCSIASMSVDVIQFDCADVGTKPVVLTVTDASGNTATAIAQVTIEDTLTPVAVVQDITVELDATGSVTIMASDIDNGSSDNCGIATYTLSQTDFDCSNAGANMVTLTVTDAAGNTDTATATVTVVDVTAPVAVAQDITVALDGTGSVSITAVDIDNGSSDNCAIVTYSLSQTDFDCDDLGVQMVTLTVTDAAGNSSDATAMVTIEDNEAPVAIGAPITITLDESGNASITADMLDNGSTDNCGIVSRSISISDFDCMDIGDFRVTLTVMDASGNMDSTIVIVTVENGNYTDTDGDGLADNCDEDDDNDGILDADDNCPLIANADQSDIDGDGIGDVCEEDRDGDGILDVNDNCPDTFNPDQADRDGNGIGDACDTDTISIAEALTPNGDGINDTWMIYNIENYPNNVVRVFNRWGHEVFAAKGYRNDWEGYYKNNQKPNNSLPDAASYYYQIDLDGNGTVDRDGWLYITRY